MGKQSEYNRLFLPVFETHFLLSFPSLWGGAASDSRAWIHQMMEEVRCPWRKSEGLPETSQSISWATAKVPLAAGFTGPSLWPRPGLWVASLCLAECCCLCLGSSPLPYPLILLVLQHSARRITSSELSSLAVHHSLRLRCCFSLHPQSPGQTSIVNDHPHSNNSWYLLALYYVSGTVLPIYRC